MPKIRAIIMSVADIKTVRGRAFLLSLLCWAAFSMPAAAQSGPVPQIEQKSRYAEPGAIPPELRREIASFLEEEMRERGISLDLKTIVLARLDAYMTGYPLPWDWGRYPPVTAYPSVATQIGWQFELESIADAARTRFFTYFEPPWETLSIAGRPDPAPTRAMLLYRVPLEIAGAQGYVATMIAQVERDSVNRAQLLKVIREAPPRKKLGRWNHPIRLTATGVASVDDRLRAAVSAVAASHPDLDIDRVLTSDRASANFFIPPVEFGGASVSTAIFCAANAKCGSMPDLAYMGRTTPAEWSTKDRAAFLGRLYLTNPYAARLGASALVELDGRGGIIAAYCGHEDIGYHMMRAEEKGIRDRGMLQYCLERGANLPR
ncbi:MAG: hypothetical protein A2885_20770 [Sphingopyxis sp. RIFCSPHIGHO2_01_FULL_65_24]|nr:MAG: hypothetical protein A2885_20770 [Sphingopyxis sp. RIFCSPHIGHO2_01_FULL_65_24]